MRQGLALRNLVAAGRVIGCPVREQWRTPHAVSSERGPLLRAVVRGGECHRISVFTEHTEYLLRWTRRERALLAWWPIGQPRFVEYDRHALGQVIPEGTNP